MNFTDISKKVVRAFYGAVYYVKDHKADIALVGGLVGGVAAGVLACRETLELPAIMDNTKQEIEEVKANHANDEDEKEMVPDLVYTYGNMAKDIFLLYAKPATVGLVSIGLIVWSHEELKKANFALATAYAGLAQSFKTYRERTVERFGKDVDFELATGAKVLPAASIVNEDGTTEPLVEDRITVKPGEMSPYARVFDESSCYWDPIFEYNKSWALAREECCRMQAAGRGRLWLNEVYRMFGFEETADGCVVGWGADDPIDLGIRTVYVPDEDGELHKGILIDPNVAGIVSKITNMREV